MPTKKKRIGFIPRFDVLSVIDNISKEEKLSNSKVVNILLEEALYARGLIKNIDKTFLNKKLKNFINNIGDFQSIYNEEDFKFFNRREEFNQSKSNIKVYKIFIQFLHFKKMVNILEEYD